jgi:hypothetical protein
LVCPQLNELVIIRITNARQKDFIASPPWLPSLP